MNIMAETFAPGEFLREEIETRGWTQIELAEIIGRPTRLVNEIISGKRAITPETAIQLGDALGTGPELWMNLESQYQLSKVTVKNNLIARRSFLYTRFPVREMIKRKWVDGSENIEVLEQQFRQFFGISSIDSDPSFLHAAKKSSAYSEATMQQMAWLFRAKAVAAECVLKRYKTEYLRNALSKISALLVSPEEARHAVRILAECGVRLIFIEHLSGSKIDGACFWLSDYQPVIAMSLRLDRIDNFWFVLRHEIEHVLQGHGRELEFILDQDLEGGVIDKQIETEEQLANQAAADFCVPKNELDDFISRVTPYFSEQRVCLFAQRLGIHPGLVVGQLQRKLNRYDFLRKHQVKIRDIVIKSAPVDGWGFIEKF
ncbi:MAG: HigA family addiction module antidote protein [Gammaproteobacteria bacterium]|nr:HigA family addiction module antidote protein [Gammaproteobacteria bacterium]MCP5125642.1 HigA family addiction module antidote protein [Gammaproteobacteria bacterium]